jgi:predicted small secreted protein
VSQEKQITEDKARQICSGFLSGRYPAAKISFGRLTRITAEGEHEYYLEGEIRVRTGGVVAQHLSPPEQYKFKFWVDASTGRILNWEMN